MRLIYWFHTSGFMLICSPFYIHLNGLTIFRLALISEISFGCIIRLGCPLAKFTFWVCQSEHPKCFSTLLIYDTPLSSGYIDPLPASVFLSLTNAQCSQNSSLLVYYLLL